MWLQPPHWGTALLHWLPLPLNYIRAVCADASAWTEPACGTTWLACEEGPPVLLLAALCDLPFLLLLERPVHTTP